MGAVYKARQSKLDRFVALKILPPEAGRDPAFTERFAREARALAKLSHANIVAVHDFGQAATPTEADGNVYYFVMEFVNGMNLRQVLQSGELQARDTLQIVPRICDALQYAHEEGVVHCDIKPENILLDKKGRVKIADFGLAKLLGQTAADHRLTATHQVMGTPYYMAPEQMEKPQQVDHRADIYSLGVVFYEMLTGELPLGRFAPPSQTVAVDARLDEVVLRTLEKEPEQRYQQVSDVKTEVESIASGVRPQSLKVPSAVAGSGTTWKPLLCSTTNWAIACCILAILSTIPHLVLHSYATERNMLAWAADVDWRISAAGPHPPGNQFYRANPLWQPILLILAGADVVIVIRMLLLHTAIWSGGLGYFFAMTGAYLSLSSLRQHHHQFSYLLGVDAIRLVLDGPDVIRTYIAKTCWFGVPACYQVHWRRSKTDASASVVRARFSGSRRVSMSHLAQIANLRRPILPQPCRS